MIRKAIALFLIAGSVAFASLILFEKNLSFEKTSGKTISRSEELSEKHLTAAGQEEDNLTGQITKDIAEKIIAENPNGPVVEEDQASITAIKPEKLVESILKENLEKFDFSSLTPKIEEGRIKTGIGSAKALEENYFKNLGVILNANLKDGSGGASLESFQKLATAYGKTVDQVYSLIVPEKLLAMHREELRLLLIRKNIFENLADYEKDPVEALISAKLLSETDKQFRQLVSRQVEYIAKNQLKI